MKKQGTLKGDQNKKEETKKEEAKPDILPSSSLKQESEKKEEVKDNKPTDLPKLLMPLGQRVMSMTNLRFNKTSNTMSRLARNPSFQGTNYDKTGNPFRQTNHKSLSPYAYPITLRRNNGIPEKLLHRLKLFQTIFKDEQFIKYYSEAPQKDKSSLEAIAKYITSYTSTHGELGVFAMIFYYIANQITYDIKARESNPTSNTPLQPNPTAPIVNQTDSNNNNNSNPVSIPNEDKDKDKDKDKLKLSTLTPNQIEQINQKPENVFMSGLALNEGFCNIFEYFLKQNKYRYKRIHGFCKYYGFRIGDDVSVDNHIWHSIMVKNEWYFCDITFASGGLVKKTPDQRYFNPYYFLTPPDFLIDSHRPSDDNWQKNPKTLTTKQFSQRSNHLLGDFYQQVYDKDLKLLTHEYPIIKSQETTFSIIIQAKDMVLQCNLFTVNGKKKITDIKYIFNEDEGLYTFDPKFPYNGDFMISIIGRSAVSTDLIYHNILNYKVKIGEGYTFKRQAMFMKKIKENAKEEMMNKGREGMISTSVNIQRRLPNMLPEINKIISDYTKIFPGKSQKKICLDNNNAYLYEPKLSILKIGNDIKFKVKIKGAVAVIVLDGRKWNYIKKKDDEIWEGNVVIQSENISICSLKSSNVFTEVFIFTAHK